MKKSMKVSEKHMGENKPLRKGQPLNKTSQLNERRGSKNGGEKVRMKRKQAGTGPSRRHIQGSKIAKRLPSVKYSFTVFEKRKFLKKKIFEKITYSEKWTDWRAKVSQCRKTERVDPLRFFNIHSVAKHEKIEENKNFHFREKISQCRKKTERGDPLGFFNIHSVAKHQKNEGGTL